MKQLERTVETTTMADARETAAKRKRFAGPTARRKKAKLVGATNICLKDENGEQR